MPSQVVATIDIVFPPHLFASGPYNFLAQNGSALHGVLTLSNEIPAALINVPPKEYANLILARSTIITNLETWRANGGQGGMAHVNGEDAITVIRRVFAQCPDEYPPPSTTDLVFIDDDILRENIRADVGAANRALGNAEWKAATVLAGAAIEALLRWRLQGPPPMEAQINCASAALVANESLKKSPNSNLDRWSLEEFIEVAAHLNVIKPDTKNAAKLAQNFRNLIHPGRAARLGMVCDRGTAYSAIGALEHVIRDVS